MTEYDVIVADPPWNFRGNSVDKPGRNARRHYDCMSLDEIRALNIPAADDAVLYLWTTAPFLAHSVGVIDAWGFIYKSNFVWIKDRIATGYWARNRHEHVLIGRRGKHPTPAPAVRRDSVIEGRQREHSRKPDALQDHIDAAFPDARKLEMFARHRRDGWTSWGNEVTDD